jgi:hypothetical protein
VRDVVHDDGEVPSQRLPDYDYSSAGAYFVTICAHRQAQIFVPLKATHAVHACWREFRRTSPSSPMRSS